MSNLEPSSFFFELPLYTKIKIDSENQEDFIQLIKGNFLIDGYNPILKENTTYSVRSDAAAKNASDLYGYSGFTKFALSCVRNKYIITIFISLTESDVQNNGGEDYILQKVGQSPSIATLNIAQIKAYDKLLTKKQIKEFSRAIGLAANGIGIGSFVYLRRIFEDLVEEAHITAKSNDTFNEDIYVRAKMKEKIVLLKDYLPEFLVENKNMYSILSKGIHELTEDECLQHFEVMKIGIEVILDEKLEKLNKKAKMEEAHRKIQGVSSQLNGK